MSNDKKSLKLVPDCSAAWYLVEHEPDLIMYRGNSRICDLLRFPGVSSHVERKTVDTILAGKENIREPVLLSVRIGVPDDMMGYDIFSGVPSG